MKNSVVYADNCQACGKEHLNIELIPVKLGNYALSRVRICLGCLIQSNDTHEDYNQAAELISTVLEKNAIDPGLTALQTGLASVETVLAAKHGKKVITLRGFRNSKGFHVTVARNQSLPFSEYAEYEKACQEVNKMLVPILSQLKKQFGVNIEVEYFDG